MNLDEANEFESSRGLPLAPETLLSFNQKHMIRNDSMPSDGTENHD